MVLNGSFVCVTSFYMDCRLYANVDVALNFLLAVGTCNPPWLAGKPLMGNT